MEKRDWESTTSIQVIEPKHWACWGRDLGSILLKSFKVLEFAPVTPQSISLQSLKMLPFRMTVGWVLRIFPADNTPPH